jgi:hypothetical protein
VGGITTPERSVRIRTSKLGALRPGARFEACDEIVETQLLEALADGL